MKKYRVDWIQFVAALAGCVVDARLEDHWLRGIWRDREGRK